MDFFAKDFAGGTLVLFSPPHIIALLSIFLLNIVLFWLKDAPEQVKKSARWAIAIVLWLNELAFHAWHIYWGIWNIQTMLPLHICSVLIWVGAIAVLTKDHRIYEFMYFMGVGGALQALLTPDVGIYGFPHFRFFQTFISHGLIITAAIYLTVVEGMRPTWKSIWRVFVGMNIYMTIVFVINQLIGSNYLFVAHKPPTASILDLLPPWPYYILYIEAIGVLTCLLLYLPFVVRDWQQQRID